MLHRSHVHVLCHSGSADRLVNARQRLSPAPCKLADRAQSSLSSGAVLASAAMASDPYAMNDDGTAKDPAAFRAALRADPVRMEALEKEPEVAAVVLGEDENAFQELIKSVYQARLGGLEGMYRALGSERGSRRACGRLEGEGPQCFRRRPAAAAGRQRRVVACLINGYESCTHASVPCRQRRSA